MLGIAIRCIQHSQAMLERGVCELAHSFFHFKILSERMISLLNLLFVDMSSVPRKLPLNKRVFDKLLLVKQSFL